MISAFVTEASTAITLTIQLKIKKKKSWSTQNGLKFSQTETFFTHFCQLHSLHYEPVMLQYDFFASNTDSDTWGSVLSDTDPDLIPVQLFLLLNQCRISISLCGTDNHSFTIN